MRKIELNAPVEDTMKKDFTFTLEPFCIESTHGDTSGVYVGTNDKSIYKFKVMSGDNTN